MCLEESKRRLLFYIADLIKSKIPSIRADTNILCTNRKEKKLLMKLILPPTF